MCGYGGYPDIARLLMDNGADLDNVDVDGDTPEILAMNRGHADMVLLFDEERLKRDQKAREADTEKPRPYVHVPLSPLCGFADIDSVSESLRRTST
jgi:ankyrin repeat protein